MKKYLLIYCLVFLMIPVLAFADVNVKDGTAITTGSEIDGCSGVASADGQPVAGGSSCTAGAGDAWLNVETADYWLITATSSHQKVDNDSAIEICQIDCTFRIGDAGNVHLEIWSDSAMGGTQYGSDSNTCNVAATPTSCTFTFGTNPEPPGDFYVFFIEEDGNLIIYSSAEPTNKYFGGTNYDLFASGVQRDCDANMTIYYMQ